MNKKVCLLVIDPQFDFCNPKGNLFVPGADEDMKRLATMIKKYGDDIEEIQITMDSHYKVHIAHARCWVNNSGKHPLPIFLNSGSTVPTFLTYEMAEKGDWRAYNPDFQARYLKYLKALDDNKRYKLMIWPEHCIIGSPGQCLESVFLQAVDQWEDRFHAVAPRTTKGSNPFTEHYSAVKADVEDPNDPLTRLNTPFINILKKYDVILGAGEALSHCFANTMRDVFSEFSADQIKKFVLLKDATSNVPGCEFMGESFIDEYKQKGMQISTTTSFF